MFKLDAQFLEEVGLGSLVGDAARANLMLATIYQTLEGRVGESLVRVMSAGQVAEFETHFALGDEAGALRVLQTSVPDYKEHVAEALRALREEIRTNADLIELVLQETENITP